ncbi:MAG: hypothetical protein B6226_00065 [Candidatus Cloacimonetes bacterium 4572_65]|nr:MAG: hypothetical protein B6226_00065 [Candidatus Cloacimonetes bacterium 4572_65]
MKKAFILLILLILSKIAYAEDFCGYVYDKNEIPLELVLVLHGNYSTYTNEQGYFSLNSTSDVDSLTFYLFGFGVKKRETSSFPTIAQVYMESKILSTKTFTFKVKNDSSVLPNNHEKVTISIDEDKKALDNVAEILSERADIKIEGTQLPGERQTASLLGHKSRHTIVMLDGVALNSSGEDFDLSTIPTEIVDRIEIYKNNMSSISGSGGIAGVINIKTIRSSKSSGNSSIGISYGSYNYKKVTLNSGFSLGRTSFYCVYSITSSENDFKYEIKKGNDWSKEIRENNSKSSQNLILNMSSNISFGSIYYSGKFSSYDNELPGPTNFLLVYEKAKSEGHELYQNLKIKKNLWSVDTDLDIYQLSKKSEYTNTEATITNNYSNNISKNSKLGAKLTNRYSYADIEPISQYSFSSSVLGSLSKPLGFFDININSSLRYDDHEDFNDFTTYRVAGDISYNSIITPTFNASYGTSFTLPSFYSLYWKGDSQAVGNPDLFPPAAFYKKELVYTPDIQLSASAVYDISNYTLKVMYNKTGKQWTTRDNLREPLSSYELVNVSASKSFSIKRIQSNISTNFNNIFNKYYEIYAYNPQAPFNWSVNLNLKYSFD